MPNGQRSRICLIRWQRQWWMPWWKESLAGLIQLRAYTVTRAGILNSFTSMSECLGMQKTLTAPLRPQSDGLIEGFIRILSQQLAILTGDHQTGPLYRTRPSVHPRFSCWGESSGHLPTDAPATPTGQEYHGDSACLCKDPARECGHEQKQNYDLKSKGRHFSDDLGDEGL